MAEDELTLLQIAEMLNLNPSTVRLWISEGRLPAHKDNSRRWIVSRSDLEQMLTQQPHIGYPKNTAARKRAATKKRPEELSGEDAMVNLADSIELIKGR